MSVELSVCSMSLRSAIGYIFSMSSKILFLSVVFSGAQQLPNRVQKSEKRSLEDK